MLVENQNVNFLLLKLRLVFDTPFNYFVYACSEKMFPSNGVILRVGLNLRCINCKQGYWIFLTIQLVQCGVCQHLYKYDSLIKFSDIKKCHRNISLRSLEILCVVL